MWTGEEFILKVIRREEKNKEKHYPCFLSFLIIALSHIYLLFLSFTLTLGAHTSFGFTALELLHHPEIIIPIIIFIIIKMIIVISLIIVMMLSPGRLTGRSAIILSSAPPHPHPTVTVFLDNSDFFFFCKGKTIKASL